jgi:hypothetical protein
VVTAAELETRCYSNRFAAHILRQAQFRAVAKSRGWKTSYQGSWGDGEMGTAEQTIPRWNLRAEFWTKAVNDEATRLYTYIGSDQVRFYRQDEREPMPLAEVPPLAFSELMRDIDLFVSVASVGNDPHWQDHGTEPRLRDYWHDFTFGDLSATGVTRKEVLKQIIPKLKIASRCTFAGNFLVVRGNLRTYKIHLGSSSILMSPNDQYLCIVPRPQGSGKNEQPMYLPFEGDERLSVILSKAFLLAADSEITDPSIVSQIDHREPL